MSPFLSKVQGCGALHLRGGRVRHEGIDQSEGFTGEGRAVVGMTRWRHQKPRVSGRHLRRPHKDDGKPELPGSRVRCPGWTPVDITTDVVWNRECCSQCCALTQGGDKGCTSWGHMALTL